MIRIIVFLNVLDPESIVINKNYPIIGVFAFSFSDVQLP